MKEIIAELEKEGVVLSKEDFIIQIGANGKAAVENIEDIEIKKKVEAVINNQFSYKATDGEISLDDLTVEKYGEIKGLPSNISALINNPGNNLTYLDYREDILTIKNYLKINDMNALPEYIAVFDVCNGSIRIKNNEQLIEWLS